MGSFLSFFVWRGSEGRDQGPVAVGRGGHLFQGDPLVPLVAEGVVPGAEDDKGQPGQTNSDLLNSFNYWQHFSAVI